MAKASSRTGSGDSGNRNKILLIVSVVILAVAGGWFYMSQPKNLDEQMREQVQAKVKEHAPAPAAETGDSSVAAPAEATADGAKDENSTSAETPAEETPAAAKKPKKPKTGAVF